MDLDQLGGLSSANQGITGIGAPGGLDLDLTSGGELITSNINPAFSNYHFRVIPDMEKTMMAETAANAMEELVKLLRIDDPLWVFSSSSDGRCTIHRDSYEKIFPRSNHFKTSSARIESSKDSGMVIMNAMQLVDMFMDTVSIYIQLCFSY